MVATITYCAIYVDSHISQANTTVGYIAIRKIPPANINIASKIENALLKKNLHKAIHIINEHSDINL